VLSLRDRGGGACVATQHPGELEALVDRMAVLVDGRLVFCGSAEEYRRSGAAAALE